MGSLLGGWRTKHSCCSPPRPQPWFQLLSSCSLPVLLQSLLLWTMASTMATSRWMASLKNDLTSMTGPSTPVTVPLSPHPQELWEERKSTQSTVSPTRLLSILPFPALEASCVGELLSTRGTSSQLPTARTTKGQQSQM